MKNYLKLLSIATILSLGLFSSCVKEDGVFDADNKGGIIELGDLSSRTTSTLYAPLVTKSFASATEVDCPITLNYTGTDGAPQDITVTMALTDAAVTAYNTAQSASYTILPTTLYTVPSYTVTIPKGQKKATFTIKLKTSSFDFSKSYALGISITSSSYGTVSANYGTGIFAIVAKNKYDGVYTVTGSFQDLSFPAYTGIYPKNIELRTTGASSVVVYNKDRSAFFYYFNTGSATSSYANFDPIFTFDDATSKVTDVTNYYGQGTANSSVRSGVLDATGINTYNATNKTISVSYIMTQSGSTRCKFTEVYTYTGSR